MIRLTKVELRRLLSRRLTFIAVLGALAITGLMLFTAVEQAKPLSAEVLASQQAGLEQAQREWKVSGEEQVKGCLEMQADTRKSDPNANAGCDQLEPKLENMGGKPVAKFNEMMPQLMVGGAYLLAFVGFVVGAGFVSAEFSSGSMANWLTFEPRRLRVYTSKLAAAGLGLIPVMAAVLGLLTAGVWLIVDHYASTAGTTAKVWGDLGGMAGRSVALAAAAAVLGAASGVLLRHTAAVLGIAIGYLVLVEGIFGQALQGARPWLLQLNFQGWLQHGTTYSVQSCTTDALGNYGCQGVERFLSFGYSAAYLGVLVVFVVGLAALVFRHRDVS
jgi:ABC-2 type transport system permease protein